MPNVLLEPMWTSTTHAMNKDKPATVKLDGQDSIVLNVSLFQKDFNEI